MKFLHGLTMSDFHRLWSTKFAWYEAPNIRRGGWSGVSKIVLETSQGTIPLYLKKQYKHTYRSWLNFFWKKPTALREYNNIKRLKAEGIPSLDPVLFAVNGDTAILGTHALEGYQSLENMDLNVLTIHQRRQMIRAVARTLRKLHLRRYQHGCLYPKHIFVRQEDSGWSVRLIDLEKMRRRLLVDAAMKHDLDTLYRRSLNLFSKHDRLTFLFAYIKVGRSHQLFQRLIQTCEH